MKPFVYAPLYVRITVMLKVWKLLPPLLVFIAGYLLFSYSLETSFDSDQPVARILIASRGVWSLITDNQDARHPWLPYLVLHYTLEIGGFGERAARMPSVIFGAGCMAVLFVLCRQYTGTLAALAAGLLLGLLPQFAQQARDVGNFSMFTFFSILSGMYFLRLMHTPEGRTPDRRDRILYILFSVLMAMSNYFFVFVTVCQAVCYLYFCRARGETAYPFFRDALIAAALSVTSVWGLIIGFFKDIPGRRVAAESSLAAWGDQSALEYLVRIKDYFFRSYYSINSEFHTVILIAICIFVITHVITSRALFKNKVLFYCLLIMLLPVACTAAATPVVRLKPYYLVFIFPHAVLFVVYGLDLLCGELSGSSVRKDLITGVGAAVFVGISSLIFIHVSSYLYESKQDQSMAPLIDHIRKNTDRTSLVLFEHHMNAWLVIFYGYDDPSAIARHAKTLPPLDDEQRAALVRQDLSFHSLQPGRFINSRDFQRETMRNLKAYQGQAYWFLQIKKKMDPVVGKYIETSCRLEKQSDFFRLYFCPAHRAGKQLPALDRTIKH